MDAKECAISLSLKLCRSNQGSLAIKFQVCNSVRPMHLFGHTFGHDYYFELLGEEERDAQSITRCWTAHHRDFRALAVLLKTKWKSRLRYSSQAQIGNSCAAKQA